MEPKNFTDWHPFMIHAGKSMDWLPSDTEELFKKNLRENRFASEKHNWIEDRFDYSFNTDGFRAPQFSSCEGGIMFLGCSFTFGIGLPVGKTFPHMVAQQMGLPCINLGLPASSNDTAFRMASTWIGKLNPKTVFLLSPTEHRFELLVHDTNSDLIESRFITTMDQLTNIENSLWLQTEQNGHINREKNILAIHKLCTDRGIKFFHDHADNFPVVDRARDLLHPGIESNRMMADRVKDILG